MLGLAAAARAAEYRAPGGGAAAGGGIADVVVTAERREISLQQAPLSVSAVPQDVLKAANITDIAGLNGSVPGLIVARSGGGERIIAIRGIGSETPENPNTQPGVSYHVDGVYVFNTIAASAAFIDVAQVEVLRGPQGTLFGQGSTGGTINVVSIDPSSDRVHANGSVGGGNHGWFEANGALNVPLGTTLAVRGAIQYSRHDGYAHATAVPGVPRYALDDADDLGWRVGAKWQPADNFSITLNTIQFRGEGNGPAQKNILDPERDARLLTQDFPGKSYVKTQLYTGIVRWDSDFATIKSITSYQKVRSNQAWDADGLDTRLFYDVSLHATRYDHVATWQQNTESFTQELNFSSNGEGPFQFVAGGVYLWSRNKIFINEYRANDFEIMRPPLADDTPVTDPRVGLLAYAELSSTTREIWAAFGQATLALTDRVKLTAGLRYNHDKASGTFDSGPGSPPASGPYLQPASLPSRSGDALTGKAALEFQMTAGNMLYASYTRGFKPGGINSAAAAGQTAYTLFGWTGAIPPTYAKETVDAFEIGSKNRFRSDSLQLNAAAFIYQYKNMQFLQEDPVLFGEGIGNAPKARTYGIEGEAVWAATRQLRFDGSIAWLEGEFTSDYLALDPGAAEAAQNAAGYPGIYGFYSNFYAASVARDGARRNINGNRVPKLPRWQGSLAATWTGAVGPGALTARAQYLYRGDYQYRLFNDGAIDKTPSYSQVNLMLRYEPVAMAGGDITLRITNLFDEEGINARFSDPYGSAQVMDVYIPPRQIIVSVGYRF